MRFSVIERLARPQHGVVSRQQLLAAGFTDAMIRSLVAAGRLTRVHQGVYALCDPSLIPLAAESAALLAAGPRAVLSHRTAAAMWSLTVGRPSEVEITIVVSHPRARAGVHMHRIRHLDRRDTTTKDRLRITTPARTIIDFAGEAPPASVEAALTEGRALNLITDHNLTAALDRAPRRHRGAAYLRALTQRQVGRVVTRSQRERKLLALLEAAGLPKPLVNHRLNGYVPDFYWPEHRLILEFDGFRTHGSRRKFESDRRRDQIYAAAGIVTLRATWLQLEREPVALVVRVGQAMAARNAA
jgi:very-short-patch-repair endonuclease